MLPAVLIGNWCLAFGQMSFGPMDTYFYRRCVGPDSQIIVRSDGFDAEGTSCELLHIRREDGSYAMSFRCTGQGLQWSEDDEIKISRNGWSLKFKITNVKRAGDPIIYCLQQGC